MKKLRDAFRREAGWIWHQKAKASALGLHLNEETITETVLLSLARQFQGGKLAITPFNKPQEARNGADWELWFASGSSSRGLGLRVQAKRLYPSGLYDSLKPAGVQTNKLIARAGACVPVFAFFNDEQMFTPSTPSCGCSYREPSYRGCIIVPAKSVSTIGSNSPGALATKSIPLHCLLCDGSSAKRAATDLSQQVAQNLDRFCDNLNAAQLADTPIPDGLLQWATATDVRRTYPEHLLPYLEARKLAGVALIKADE